MNMSNIAALASYIEDAASNLWGLFAVYGENAPENEVRALANALSENVGKLTAELNPPVEGDQAVPRGRAGKS